MVLGTMGGGEWLLIILLAFLLFGPKKLPELARSLGLASSEYRRAVREGEESLAPRPPVERAAEALGIETKGKDEAQLREEVAARMREPAAEGPAAPAGVGSAPPPAKAAGKRPPARKGAAGGAA